MQTKEQYHVEKLITGDQKSFTILHEQYQSRIYHFCYRFVRNNAIAQEITSDVFIRLWEKRSTLQPDKSVSGLLFKISRDYCMSYLRKVARDEKLKTAYIHQYFQDQLHSEKNDSVYLERNLTMAKKAIESLPRKCQEVFRLRYLEGLSLLQIAEELNISPHTVKNHLQKGNQLIKSFLQTNSDLVFVLILATIDLY